MTFFQCSDFSSVPTSLQPIPMRRCASDPLYLLALQGTGMASATVSTTVFEVAAALSGLEITRCGTHGT